MEELEIVCHNCDWYNYLLSNQLKLHKRFNCEYCEFLILMVDENLLEEFN